MGIIHYLEIVTTEVDSTCEAYAVSCNVKFGPPDPLLGGARVCFMADGSQTGVRPPLRDTEAPIIRAYWLVRNVEAALAVAQARGAEVALPPTHIPTKGTCGIYILGGVEHGVWQLGPAK